MVAPMAGKRHRSIWITTAVAALVLAGGALAPSASATNFCVYKSFMDCPPSSDDLTHGDNLTAAVQAAEATAEPDQIYIGPGTYDAADHGPFLVYVINPLTIAGAGSDRTTLRSSSSTGNAVLDMVSSTGDLDLSRVKIEMAGSVHGGLRIDGATARLVDVVGESS